MKRSMKGFSLIELMISVVLGLVLMTGVMSVFLGNKTAFMSQQAISRVQETGRLAVEFISKDIRMAGYMGCTSKKGGIVSMLKSKSSFPSDMLSIIHGYSAEPADSNLSPDPLPNTDLLMITSADSSGIRVVKDNESAKVFGVLSAVEAGACKDHSDRVGGICSGDILLITDCAKATIFQGTTISNTSEITHAGSGTPGNDIAAWGGATDPDPKNQYKDGSEIIKLTKRVYYIATGKSGLPSLWQNSNGEALELLEGVEDMSLTYGLDTTNDDIPDSYLTAAQVSAAGTDAWSRVLSVRVQLLIQSAEDNVLPEKQIYTFAEDVNKTASDRRMRQIFTGTVGIRSRLP